MFTAYDNDIDHDLSGPQWASLGFDEHLYQSVSPTPVPECRVQTGTVPETDNDLRADTGAFPSAIVDNWQQFLKADLSDELRDRLIRLAAKPCGWKGSGSKKLHSRAVAEFIKFYRLVNVYHAPFLTLAPSGGLYGEWHASWRRHLDIEFSPDGYILLALIDGADLYEVKTDAAHAAALISARATDPTRWHLS